MESTTTTIDQLVNCAKEAVHPTGARKELSALQLPPEGSAPSAARRGMRTLRTRTEEALRYAPRLAKFADALERADVDAVETDAPAPTVKLAAETARAMIAALDHVHAMIADGDVGAVRAALDRVSVMVDTLRTVQLAEEARVRSAGASDHLERAEALDQLVDVDGADDRDFILHHLDRAAQKATDAADAALAARAALDQLVDADDRNAAVGAILQSVGRAHNAARSASGACNYSSHAAAERMRRVAQLEPANADAMIDTALGRRGADEADVDGAPDGPPVDGADHASDTIHYALEAAESLRNMAARTYTDVEDAVGRAALYREADNDREKARRSALAQGNVNEARLHRAGARAAARAAAELEAAAYSAAYRTENAFTVCERIEALPTGADEADVDAEISADMVMYAVALAESAERAADALYQAMARVRAEEWRERETIAQDLVDECDRVRSAAEEAREAAEALDGTDDLVDRVLAALDADHLVDNVRDWSLEARRTTRRLQLLAPHTGADVDARRSSSRYADDRSYHAEDAIAEFWSDVDSFTSGAALDRARTAASDVDTVRAEIADHADRMLEAIRENAAEVYREIHAAMIGARYHVRLVRAADVVDGDHDRAAVERLYRAILRTDRAAARAWTDDPDQWTVGRLTTIDRAYRMAAEYADRAEDEADVDNRTAQRAGCVHDRALWSAGALAARTWSGAKALEADDRAQRNVERAFDRIRVVEEIERRAESNAYRHNDHVGALVTIHGARVLVEGRAADVVDRAEALYAQTLEARRGRIAIYGDYSAATLAEISEYAEDGADAPTFCRRCHGLVIDDVEPRMITVSEWAAREFGSVGADAPDGDAPEEDEDEIVLSVCGCSHGGATADCAAPWCFPVGGPCVCAAPADPKPIGWSVCLECHSDTCAKCGACSEALDHYMVDWPCETCVGQAARNDTAAMVGLLHDLVVHAMEADRTARAVSWSSGAPAPVHWSDAIAHEAEDVFYDSMSGDGGDGDYGYCDSDTSYSADGWTAALDIAGDIRGAILRVSAPDGASFAYGYGRPVDTYDPDEADDRAAALLPAIGGAAICLACAGADAGPTGICAHCAEIEAVRMRRALADADRERRADRADRADRNSAGRAARRGRSAYKRLEARADRRRVHQRYGALVRQHVIESQSE